MNSELETEVLARIGEARAAATTLAFSPHEARCAAIRRAAELLSERMEEILAANALDLQEAEPMRASGELSDSAYQRLKLDRVKVEEMIRGLESVVALADPLAKVQIRRQLDEGLVLERRPVPLGVLAVIFESRPDAAVQISSLAIKSGNAALLKGGRESAHSVACLVSLMQQGLEEAGLSRNALVILENRASIDILLQQSQSVDLVIPRGSSQLVRSIQARTRIPVLGHAEGICHMFLDRSADKSMAVRLVRDAKLQYPAACNAVETVLIHEAIALEMIPMLVADLTPRGVELRGCAATLAIAPMVKPATDADWDTEYGAPILALRIVKDLDDALAHIRAHSSGHTECIITEDALSADRFIREVDAAGVYHNASTRFADGFRYGFGAEVGISTARIHARGPVGLEGLLIYKYVLQGHGHEVAPYCGEGAKPLHADDLPL
nr:glutamate-5-semialdehyde dehydrogenase [uncultured Holophaga sp.]